MRERTGAVHARDVQVHVLLIFFHFKCVICVRFFTYNYSLFPLLLFINNFLKSYCNRNNN